MRESELREFVRQVFEKIAEGDVDEHFRHGDSPHKHTPTSHKVISTMQRDSALQKAFDLIKKPQDLTAIIEELIDASGLSRDEISKSIKMIMQHEKPRGGAVRENLVNVKGKTRNI